ncbi:hypothetical protein BB560_006903 [Smittium megazygosporum]|uniref:Uncharacterized protein n=1 Tax=Smittium megazygosporum TaxID=133381 RepID=A0A2T9Y0B9_9FUNG|nr:hypothetical protein BB560_006903 [Smittium megazygosporum]
MKIVYSEKVVGFRIAHFVNQDVSSRGNTRNKQNYGRYGDENFIVDSGLGNTTVVINFVFEKQSDIPVFINMLHGLGIRTEKRVKKPTRDQLSNNSIFSQGERLQQGTSYTEEIRPLSQLYPNPIAYSQNLSEFDRLNSQSSFSGFNSQKTDFYDSYSGMLGYHNDPFNALDYEGQGLKLKTEPQGSSKSCFDQQTSTYLSHPSTVAKCDYPISNLGLAQADISEDKLSQITSKIINHLKRKSFLDLVAQLEKEILPDRK